MFPGGGLKTSSSLLFGLPMLPRCQVSHHPPISAFHVCNRKDGFSISGSILAKSKFYGNYPTTVHEMRLSFSTNFTRITYKRSSVSGNSLSAILDGKARLLFLNRNEEYVITMPYAHCKGKQCECVCPVMDLETSVSSGTASNSPLPKRAMIIQADLAGAGLFTDAR